MEYSVKTSERGEKMTHSSTVDKAERSNKMAISGHFFYKLTADAFPRRFLPFFKMKGSLNFTEVNLT